MYKIPNINRRCGLLFSVWCSVGVSTGLLAGLLFRSWGFVCLICGIVVGLLFAYWVLVGFLLDSCCLFVFVCVFLVGLLLGACWFLAVSGCPLAPNTERPPIVEGVPPQCLNAGFKADEESKKGDFIRANDGTAEEQAVMS